MGEWMNELDGWGEGGHGFRPPVKTDWFWFDLSFDGPPIWATSIARPRGRRLDGLARARSGTGGVGSSATSGRLPIHSTMSAQCWGMVSNDVDEAARGSRRWFGRRDRDMTGEHGD